EGGTVPRALGAPGRVGGAGGRQGAAEFFEGVPQAGVGPGGADRPAGPGDDRAGVVEQPDGGPADGGAGPRLAVGVPPLDALAAHLAGPAAGLVEHGALLQPPDVGGGGGPRGRPG